MALRYDMTEGQDELLSGLSVTKCYKCTDGEVFEEFEEAKIHQIRLNFCEDLESILKDVRVAGFPIEDNEKAFMTDAIMNHLDWWADLFQTYLEQRG